MNKYKEMRIPDAAEEAKIAELRKKNSYSYPRHLFVSDGHLLHECEPDAVNAVLKDGEPKKAGNHEQVSVDRHRKKTNCPCHVFEDKSSRLIPGVVRFPGLRCVECEEEFRY